MPKISINWEHTADRTLERVPADHRARIQTTIVALSSMQAPPEATGHYSWHINFYDKDQRRIATIIFRGIAARTVYGPNENVPGGSVRYSIKNGRFVKATALLNAGKQPAKKSEFEIPLLQEVFSEADNEMNHMLDFDQLGAKFNQWANRAGKSPFFKKFVPLMLKTGQLLSPAPPPHTPTPPVPIVAPPAPPRPAPPPKNPLGPLSTISEEEKRRRREQEEKDRKLPQKTAAGGKPNTEVSVMQEIFNETNNEYESGYGF